MPYDDPLTPREREVLHMLAAGLGNKEIGARLGISDHTAKFHVSQILAKLNAGSRAEAVSIAMRRGLVPL
jgi:DNA-binding CsgD family transcriptional regulator